jgi:ribonuclease BN (tRNA processing enzyme)
MKLTVLGGSAAGANTGQGCSGYLVTAGRTRLVLDLGPGTLIELRRHVDYRRLDAIVVSHLHLDHVLDLLALRFLLAYNPVPRSDRLPLWLPPGGHDFLARAAPAFAQPGKEDEFFPSVFAVEEYDPRSGVTIGHAVLRFAPTVHYVPCWAIRVDERETGRSLVYTADTGPAADLIDFGRGAEVVVAEATLLDPGDEPFATRGHLTAEEAAALAAAVGAGTLLATHVWEELGRENVRAQAAARFTGRVVLAEPGATLEW